ncbi:hypothetical protein GCM10011613_12780 [Cellvibrio zantedeschiae]|uniref:Uncharacterized protein n=1 Tax=Cellvibrio zantedeschiae TaxID=1237077 RepID=A0ABQ3AXV8_9GAMM|nr:hypothetical protein [Cellvibrio zantedeschiae]GGY69860.1 hypothetical protein GCM10011613_12780 [Cellvibrio zantedeschiae]
MATSQRAFQPNTELPQHFASTLKAQPKAIDLEHVSVSQLLGRDYVFLNSREIELPLKNPAVLHSLLDDLIQQLELAETHTVAVSVDESLTGALTFVRHDLTWYRHKVCRVESITISHPEQHEFMEMIWRCSTAAVTIY